VARVESMANPLIRLLSQIGLSVATVFGKAFSKAYKNAAAEAAEARQTQHSPAAAKRHSQLQRVTAHLFLLSLLSLSCRAHRSCGQQLVVVVIVRLS
jgi:hypothetical protein